MHWLFLLEPRKSSIFNFGFWSTVNRDMCPAPEIYFDIELNLLQSL